MAEKNGIKQEFCLDCRAPIEEPLPGIFSGSIRTDGNKNIKEAVPGGIIYGKILGHVCCECSLFGKENRKK